MAVTINLKKQIDMPVWEWCRFAPTASGATSALTTVEDGSDRFIYYLTASTFYRYDTYYDTWQQLATPNTAPVTGVTMRYTALRGSHGRVISATSTTIQIGGLRGPVYNGKTIKILRGTGQGQDRVLTYSTETIHDFGVITGTAANYLQDSTKKWKFNQWAGYTVGITFGTDVTQYKEILYNDATTLYISDANLMPHNHWDNQAFTATAPYALPVTTAGSQAHYQISSQTFTVPTWDVIPDNTTFYTTTTGGIYLVSSSASAPFLTLQYYDILADNWQTKTVPQSLILAALGTDFTVERLPRITYYLSSTATSGTSKTLVDTSQTLTPDRYKNYRLEIVGGTGLGQHRRIVCNTATTFTIARAWDISPDSTSAYKVWGDYDKVFLAGGAASAIFAYTPKEDYWMQGPNFDDGVTNNIGVRMNGWETVGVSTGVYIASGVTAIDSTPTAPGTGYLIGDILTCSVGGTGAKVIVTATTTSGAVSSLELVCSGTATGFTAGTGKTTSGGTGSGCTINITSVGITCYVTTATAHWFRTGDSVTVFGCTASSYNSTFTILGVDSTTSFSIAVSGVSASMVASNSQSTTLIVDSSKNWTINEHVGRLVHLCVAGTAPTSQIRWITANTATTLTVATITAGVNGTSKYSIYDAKSFGRDDQYKQDVKMNFGHASGGSTTTLVDSSKNWFINQWAGYKMKIEAGVGYGSGIISIVSNTTNTLTYTTQTFTPDSSTHYEIADSWGLMTASTTTSITETTTKNWIVNQWAGKRVRISAGTGLGQEATIASNTATALTTGTITAGDATSVYTILGIPARGAGIELMWVSNETNTITKGRRIFCPRGGSSNTFDIYDIPTEKWTYGYFISPQQETLAAGTYYAYDGGDIIYFTKPTASVNARVFAWDLTSNIVTCIGSPPYADSTLTIGNRMEVIETVDGIKYLYYMRNTGQEMWRMLIF